MIKREISEHLSYLAQKYPVISITGPRQSGKTTLAKMAFANKTYINLELLDNRDFAISDPRGFLRKIPEGAILDEIQRAPELVSYIQGIVDEKKQNGMFILTGSQQFEVSNSINQSLAGRAALLKLLPFSLSEIQGNYNISDIDQLLFHGFYPRIYDQKLDPTQALADYFETYVERDLRQLVQIKNLSQFQKFVKLCAGRIGQILNLNSLSNDVGISHTTAREWITMLEASYIIFLLEPFYRNIKKRLIKSPKIYFYDVGLASYLLGVEKQVHLDAHPLRGNLFENLVIMEVLKNRFNNGKKNNLNFFRDSIGNEVDLIYNFGSHFLPIEIKASETFSSDFTKGLDVLKKLFLEFPYGRLVVYAGKKTESRDDIKIIPFNQLNDTLSQIL